MPTPRAPKNPETNPKVRIQRVLAEAGIASRRACEALVEEGAVSVNGRVVQGLPCFVDPESDSILVSGRRIKKPRRHYYIMLFKPRGFVCTSSDPEGRKLALDLVDHPSAVRLFSVGRLDIDSSGLLLLTDDGELTNRLTHPSYEVHKGYDVSVRGRVEEEEVEKLRKGLYLSDRKKGTATRTAESGVTVLRRDRDRTRLYVELREGRNRQIRRLMERIGHPVKRLRRVRFGPLKLKGLAVGEWRELSPVELGTLRRASTAEARRVIHRAVVEKRKKAKRKKTGAVTVMGRPLKEDPVKRAGKTASPRSGGSRTGSKTGSRTGSRTGSKSTSRTGSRTGSKSTPRTGSRTGSKSTPRTGSRT
ncbi:MAG: pseudouridine synthase, partial [Phycisphaerales bacterium]|nr:pseudouridine synthase [Phycisphaerales bacterium]